MNTRTEIAVVAVSAATALIVSLAVWFAIERHKPTLARPYTSAHTELCELYDDRIGVALNDKNRSGFPPDDAAEVARAANLAGCYAQ
jgi:hypothetical protein